MFQATQAVSRPLGLWPCAERPACYRLAHGQLTGMPGQPAYRADGVIDTEKRHWY